MPLLVRPAAAADARRAAAIERRAFASDPASAVMFPGPFPPDGDHHHADALASHLRDHACRWVKVVDTDLEAAGAGDDALVAFAVWYLWDAPPDALPPAGAWGPGTNPEACELFFGAMRSEWHRRMRDLKVLVTDPKHQRRGAASMLLEWGAAEAHRLGLPSYLEATDKGQRQYEKHGFRPVGKIVTDLSPWNGPAHADIILMLRPASGG